MRLTRDGSVTKPMIRISAPQRGDELSDARWEVGFELQVPGGLRSGIYAARITAGVERLTSQSSSQNFSVAGIGVDKTTGMLDRNRPGV